MIGWVEAEEIVGDKRLEVAFKGLELCHDKQVGSEAQNELTTCFEGHKNVIISHVGVPLVERNYAT